MSDEAAGQRLARPRQPVVLHEDPRRRGLGDASRPTSTSSCRTCSTPCAELRSQDHVLRRRAGRGARAEPRGARALVATRARDRQPLVPPRAVDAHLFDRSGSSASWPRRPRRSRRVTGRQPVGYRGPGFSWNADAARGAGTSAATCYDASTLPTYIGPLARLYYFRTVATSPGRRWTSARTCSAASARAGARSSPTCGACASGRTLLEIPVTTMPLVKMPFHLSYLLYLSRFSRGADAGLPQDGAPPVPPDRHRAELPAAPARPARRASRCRQLAFFPGMDLSRGHKRERLPRACCAELGQSFELVRHERTRRRASGAIGRVRA